MKKNENSLQKLLHIVTTESEKKVLILMSKKAGTTVTKKGKAPLKSSVKVQRKIFR